MQNNPADDLDARAAELEEQQQLLLEWQAKLDSREEELRQAEEELRQAEEEYEDAIDQLHERQQELDEREQALRQRERTVRAAEWRLREHFNDREETVEDVSRRFNGLDEEEAKHLLGMESPPMLHTPTGGETQYGPKSTSQQRIEAFNARSTAADESVSEKRVRFEVPEESRMGVRSPPKATGANQSQDGSRSTKKQKVLRHRVDPQTRPDTPPPGAPGADFSAFIARIPSPPAAAIPHAQLSPLTADSRKRKHQKDDEEDKQAATEEYISQDLLFANVELLVSETDAARPGFKPEDVFARAGVTQAIYQEGFLRGSAAGGEQWGEAKRDHIVRCLFIPKAVDRSFYDGEETAESLKEKMRLQKRMFHASKRRMAGLEDVEEEDGDFSDDSEEDEEHKREDVDMDHEIEGAGGA